MGYAIVRVEKMKSAKDMENSYNHNMRVYDVMNADRSRQKFNEELIDLNGMDYEQAFRRTLADLHMQGVPVKTVRKDAVKMLEVFLGFSHDDAEHIDVDEWKKSSMRWLEDTFNPPGHEAHFRDGAGEERVAKTNNVVSATLHMDEGTPHIHAIVVPINVEGNLNAHSYIGSRQSMIEVQDGYGRAMEEFGLKRGARHSAARHQDNSTYYNNILRAVHAELPEVIPGETAEQYRERSNEFYQVQQSHHVDEMMRLTRRINEAHSSIVQERLDMEMDTRSLERQVRKLAREYGDDEVTERVVKEIRRHTAERRLFENGVKEYPDRERAAQAESYYQEIVEWQKQRERKLRQKSKSAPAESE